MTHEAIVSLLCMSLIPIQEGEEGRGREEREKGGRKDEREGGKRKGREEGGEGGRKEEREGGKRRGREEGGEGGRKEEREGGRGRGREEGEGRKGRGKEKKKSRRFMYTAVRHPPLIRKKKAPVSFATARAMRVFPVPGGP